MCVCVCTRLYRSANTEGCCRDAAGETSLQPRRVSCLQLSDSFLREGAYLITRVSCPHSLSLKAILPVVGVINDAVGCNVLFVALLRPNILYYTNTLSLA